MEGSIVLFLIGAAASTTIIAGLIWPLSRVLYFLLAPTRAVWFAVTTGVFALSILLVSAFSIYILYTGYFATPQTRIYESYNFLTSSFVTMFGLGLFMGPLTYFWLYYYRLERPTDVEKRNHFTLTVALCVIITLALISPFLSRWLSNATSLEISQIGKITIDAKQPAAFQSPPFITGLSTTSAASEFRGFELVRSLVQLQDFGLGSENIITRDTVYDGLLRRKRDDAKANKIATALTKDYEFLALLHPMAKCLESYAKEFRDYRLLLVDIKQAILTMTTIAKNHDPMLSKNLVTKLGMEVQKLTEDARTSLERLFTEAPAKAAVAHDCRDLTGAQAFEFSWNNDTQIDAGNVLPYKTIALAYMLSAIGAADTAIVELAGWLDRNNNSETNWYTLRASTELLLLLEGILPGAHKHRSYKDFLDRKLRDLANTIPNSNLKEWMKDCSKTQRSMHEVNLYFTYITQLNSYVKGASNLDEINERIVQIAQTNKEIDYQCFVHLDDVFPERHAWHAEFLTNYAISLLVTSYDESLFGRSEHPERQRLRAIASRDLLHAIQLLEPIVRQNRWNLGQQPEAARIFSRPRWEDTLQIAKEARRSIVDVDK
jgi:hypothetical protein